MPEIMRAHPIVKILPYGLVKWFLNHTYGHTFILNTCGSYSEYRCVYLGNGVYFLCNRQKALRAKFNRLKNKVEVLEGHLKDAEKMDIKSENINRMA